MRKLLSAGMSRLWKDKVFWICMGAMLLYTMVYMINGCRQATHSMQEYNIRIDSYYFHVAMVIGAFCALFSSMFLGTEYSDGTIRNKIVSGHTRAAIYLTNAVLSFFATALILSVWLVGALVAIPALGVFAMDASQLLLYLLAVVFCVASFSAIFTFIAMQSSNKAVTVAISILFFFGLLLYAGTIYNALGQPELTNEILVTANGMDMTDPVPNPAYVSGTKRAVYEFILDFLPTGQGISIWELKAANPIRMLLSSAAITVFVTIGGMAAFQKKNLK